MTIMDLTEQQQLLLDTARRRNRAQEVLESLVSARSECEAHMSRVHRSDAIKSVTGLSAMDRAIASTGRMIEALEAAIREVTRSLSREDLEVIGMSHLA